jgi:hypothetical protein
MMLTADDRYKSDPAFKSLVDMMVAFICRNEFTPSEMREAALLACIIYDYYYRREIILDPSNYQPKPVPPKDE